MAERIVGRVREPTPGEIEIIRQALDVFRVAVARLEIPLLADTAASAQRWWNEFADGLRAARGASQPNEE